MKYTITTTYLNERSNFRESYLKDKDLVLEALRKGTPISKSKDGTDVRTLFEHFKHVEFGEFLLDVAATTSHNILLYYVSEVAQPKKLIESLSDFAAKIILSPGDDIEDVVSKLYVVEMKRPSKANMRETNSRREVPL